VKIGGKVTNLRIIAPVLVTLWFALAHSPAQADRPIILTQGAHGPTGAPPADATTPEERMRRRFPQPVRVGDLIGLRVLDENDVTLGRVQKVVRTGSGKVLLIVSYGGWFGIGSRDVAVPIEVVAILGRQIAALDMQPSEFAAAPTWMGTDARAIANDEFIKIAITRR
jgi:hypothetical protein